MALGRKTGDSRSSLGLTPGGITTGDRIDTEEPTREVSIWRAHKPFPGAILSARLLPEIGFSLAPNRFGSKWGGASATWVVSSQLETTKEGLAPSIPSWGLLSPKTSEHGPELKSSLNKLNMRVLGLGVGSIQSSVNAPRLPVPDIEMTTGAQTETGKEKCTIQVETTNMNNCGNKIKNQINKCITASLQSMIRYMYIKYIEHMNNPKELD